MKDISTNEQKSKKNSIVLSFDDQDDFEFKPLTKGLGFHHTEKKQTQVRTNTGVMNRSISATGARKSIPTNPSLKSTPTQKLATPNSLPQELKAFYETPAEPTSMPALPSVGSAQIQEVKVSTKAAILSEEVKSAPRIIQLSAWIVDIVVISFFVVATMSALFFMLGIEFSSWKEVLLLDRNYIVPISLFAIYYILYFGILDLVGGVGKTLMGLKVVSRVPGEKISFFKTLLRSIVSLLSLGAFGLPHIVDFQGKLSDTEVVSE